MNLCGLSDNELLSRTKDLVRRERELLGEILKHLREVERRRLFSELKYKSLFEYTVKELQYSEDQAYRRINAMRLIKELPQIEEKVIDGSLSLSALGVASSLFKTEAKFSKPMHGNKKLEVLKALNNKSRREAESIVQTLTTLPKEALKPEKARAAGSFEEWRLMANTVLQEKVGRVKGLLAHSHPDISTMELLEKFCDDFLDEHQKAIEPKNRDQVSSPKKMSSNSTLKNAPPRNGALGVRGRISAATRRLVWNKAGSKCEICGSGYALQIDHVQPVAHGGVHELDNLRLLCRSCNQRAAIDAFGIQKMHKFLRDKAVLYG